MQTFTTSRSFLTIPVASSHTCACIIAAQVIAIDSFVNIEFDDELKVGIEGLAGG